MKTLLVGEIDRIKCVVMMLQFSKSSFEIPFIISEDEQKLDGTDCEVYPIEVLPQVPNVFELIFICGKKYSEYSDVLTAAGIPETIIKSDRQIEEYVPADKIMGVYAAIIREKGLAKYKDKDHILIGDFTYGYAEVHGFPSFPRENETLTIGKFCSIADGVAFMLGSEHDPGLCTTYPFNMLFKEYADINSHPRLKGNIVVGNDVWFGSDCKIMSGVTIGDGACIAANAVVTKDVPPYAIVGGVPAKVIRKRFPDEIIEKFMEIKWWDWPWEMIYKAIPILQSGSYEELFAFYDEFHKTG